MTAGQRDYPTLNGKVPGTPEWVRDQKAVREAEDMAAHRKAYDAWARQYADSGVRVDAPALSKAPAGTPRKRRGFRLGRGSR